MADEEVWRSVLIKAKVEGADEAEKELDKISKAIQDAVKDSKKVEAAELKVIEKLRRQRDKAAESLDKIIDSATDFQLKQSKIAEAVASKQVQIDDMLIDKSTEKFLKESEMQEEAAALARKVQGELARGAGMGLAFPRVPLTRPYGGEPTGESVEMPSPPTPSPTGVFNRFNSAVARIGDRIDILRNRTVFYGRSMTTLGKVYDNVKKRLNKFQYAFLSTMFAGMQMQRMFGGLVSRIADMVGISALFETIITMALLPVMLDLLPVVMRLFKAFMELSPSMKYLIGVMILLGAVIGAIVAFVSQLALLLQGVLILLSPLIALVAIVLVTIAGVSEAIAGWLAILVVLGGTILTVVVAFMALIAVLVKIYGIVNALNNQGIYVESLWEGLKEKLGNITTIKAKTVETKDIKTQGAMSVAASAAIATALLDEAFGVTEKIKQAVRNIAGERITEEKLQQVLSAQGVAAPVAEEGGILDTITSSIESMFTDFKSRMDEIFGGKEGGVGTTLLAEEGKEYKLTFIWQTLEDSIFGEGGYDGWYNRNIKPLRTTISTAVFGEGGFTGWKERNIIPIQTAISNIIFGEGGYDGWKTRNVTPLLNDIKTLPFGEGGFDGWFNRNIIPLRNTLSNLLFGEGGYTKWYADNIQPIIDALSNMFKDVSFGSLTSAIGKMMRDVKDKIGSIGWSALNTLSRGTLEGLASLAEGGIVTRPMLATVGEKGPEAVVPLDRYGSVVNFTPYITVNATISSSYDVDQLANQLASRWNDDLRRLLIK